MGAPCSRRRWRRPAGRRGSSGGGSPAWAPQRRGSEGEEGAWGARMGDLPGPCLCPEPSAQGLPNPRERTPAPPGAVGTSCLVPAQRGLAPGPHHREGEPGRTVRAPAGQLSACLREKRPGGGRAHRRTLQGRSGRRPVLGTSLTQEPCPQGMAVPPAGKDRALALRCCPAVERGLTPMPAAPILGHHGQGPSPGPRPGQCPFFEWGWLLTSIGKRLSWDWGPRV